METKMGPEAEAKLQSLIKDAKVAMVATRAEGGRLHARPMVAAKTAFEDRALWFFTDRRSRKVDEAEDDDRVLLTYADWDSQSYVAIEGRAELVDDRARIDALWSEGVRTWFPKGKDDPNIVLFKVTVESAEYWDAPNSTMVQAYGYLKAVTTGKRPHPGETGRVLF